ncbi:MAG: hypothetical protein LBG60_10915 [Bifidobacteriaceae bacterium]|nr:hypothetical protein [Bifidobacteriaceae bacterium]
MQIGGNQPNPIPAGVPLSPQATLLLLGRARFQRYLSAVGGDDQTALALYAWNAGVAAAALTEVWHLEVAMRNA